MTRYGRRTHKNNSSMRVNIPYVFVPKKWQYECKQLKLTVTSSIYSQERISSEHGLTERLTIRHEMVECPSLRCVSCCCCCCCCWWWWWLLWWWCGWFPSSLLGPRPLSLFESQLFGEQFSSSIRSLMNATTGFVLFDIGCSDTHGLQRYTSFIHQKKLVAKLKNTESKLK